MGLDFSYLLYFKRNALWEALNGVAAVARPSELPTLVVFSDHILPLTLEPWDDKERMVKYDDPEFGFKISIYFQEDDEITNYAKRSFPEYYETMAKESPIGFPIGYIYTTVFNNLGSLEQKTVDPDLVMIEFDTTGTNMSLLFSNSSSIRKRFRGLLREFQGVCGVLNMEISGQVFWLNGKTVKLEIDNPLLRPKEIEVMLARPQKEDS